MAIICAAQSVLVTWYFPRHGCLHMQRGAHREEDDVLPESEAGPGGRPPWVVKALHRMKLAFIIYAVFAYSALITGWEISISLVLQETFGMSTQKAALILGAFVATTGKCEIRTPTPLSPFNMPTLTFDVCILQGASSLIFGHFAHRLQERNVILGATGVLLLSCIPMFKYGSAGLILPSYLCGSFVFVNASTVAYVFMLALSSKVCHRREIEPMNSFMNIAILFARFVGPYTGVSLLSF